MNHDVDRTVIWPTISENLRHLKHDLKPSRWQEDDFHIRYVLGRRTDQTETRDLFRSYSAEERVDCPRKSKEVGRL